MANMRLVGFLKLSTTLLLLVLGLACASDEPEQVEIPKDRKVEILLTAHEGESPDQVTRPTFPEDEYKEMREQLINQIIAQGFEDEAVLDVMRRVPRHEFVNPEDRDVAYADRPVPIGHGQTISQPHLVAEMTSLLKLQPTDKVLEIGTGSAYQAAILAELAEKVISIEILEPLAKQAAERLKRLGYENVTVIRGDGYLGWEEEAPYDAIIVTATAEHIPPPLFAQLKVGGRMVIPVGQSSWTQNLLYIEKKEGDEKPITRKVETVRFVPLTREE